MWNWQTREFPKNFFGNSKKSVRTFKLRIDPYFLSHAERGESEENQDFVGGIQNRRRFAPTIFLVQKPFSKNCGGGEIRTPDTLRYTAFPRQRTRPLCDPSTCIFTYPPLSPSAILLHQTSPSACSRYIHRTLGATY